MSENILNSRLYISIVYRKNTWDRQNSLYLATLFKNKTKNNNKQSFWMSFVILIQFPLIIYSLAIFI